MFLFQMEYDINIQWICYIKLKEEIMKKRIFTIALAAVTAVTMFGCGSAGSKVVDQGKKDYKLSDYVKLGEYKGIEAEKPESIEVTDEEIQSEIDYALSENSTETEITDRAVQTGDTVNINCAATLDGEAYTEGTFDEYPLEIGSGDFIDGFESGLVGKNVGDEVELNLTFPEDYDSGIVDETQTGDEATDSVAGKAVQFKVAINSISLVSVPELTDDYVIENTEYKTVDEYKEGIKKTLEDTNEENIKYQVEDDVFQKVIENATVDGYPEELYDEFYANVESSYTSMAESMGTSVDDLYTQFGMTEEDVKNEAIVQIQEYLIWQMVAEKENIELTQDEYDEGLAELAKYYSEQDETEYTAKDMEENYGEDAIAEELLRQEVMEYLVSKAKISEVPYDEYIAEDTEEVQTVDEAAEEDMIEEEQGATEEINESDIEIVK